MTFSEALVNLRIGQRVRRSQGEELHYTAHGSIHRYDSKSRIWHHWVPTQSDILSDDWEVVLNSTTPNPHPRLGIPTRYDRKPVI